VLEFEASRNIKVYSEQETGARTLNTQEWASASFRNVAHGAKYYGNEGQVQISERA